MMRSRLNRGAVGIQLAERSVSKSMTVPTCASSNQRTVDGGARGVRALVRVMGKRPRIHPVA